MNFFNLPKRFYAHIKFELGIFDEEMSFDNSYSIQSFNSFIFTRWSKNSSFSITIPIIFNYYYSFYEKQLDPLLLANSLELFFDDISLVDNALKTELLKGNEYELLFPKTFSENVFYFDNYPYYKFDESEIFDKFQNCSNDILESKLFFTNLQFAESYVSTKSSQYYVTERYQLERFDFKNFFSFYYLTKNFIGLLGDEERYYNTLQQLIYVVPIALVTLLTIYLFIQNTYVNLFWSYKLFVWTTFRVPYDELQEGIVYYLFHPVEIVNLGKYVLWSHWMGLKLGLAYLYDYLLYPRYRRDKALLTEHCFHFQNPRNRRIKYGKMFEKYFW